MYIAICGIDGSGKTTLIKLVEKFILNNISTKVFIHDAMKPCEFHDQLDKVEILHDNIKSYDFFSPELVNLTYCADLYRNYYNIIRPKLEEDYIVITHRSRLCCRVYSEVFTEKLNIIDTILQAIPYPDLSFFLKTSPEVALKRVYNREHKENVPVVRKENLVVFKKATQIYERLISESEASIITINGDRNINDIENEVCSILSKKYKLSVKNI